MKEKIEITDIALASALIIKGKNLIEVRKRGRYCTFIFEKDKILEGLVESYYKDELLVSAKRLFQEYKTLKQIRFNFKGGENGQKNWNYNPH
ncbi:MAG TPA: DUF5659 domain-containing protein [Defluviitoga tunisiensis]|nr:DUF5659 domain-containing protein [bacterium]HPP10259.1 DUF5659 domain-containing protein [Defluviitoga tunisiensis]